MPRLSQSLALAAVMHSWVGLRRGGDRSLQTEVGCCSERKKQLGAG